MSVNLINQYPMEKIRNNSMCVIIGLFVLTCSCTQHSAELSQTVYNQGVEIKIPSTWRFKNQELIAGMTYQTTCWDSESENVLMIDITKRKIDPIGYLQIIKDSFNKIAVYNDAAYSNLTQGTFQGVKTYETSFFGKYMGTDFEGKIISFNSNENSFAIIYQGNSSFIKSKLLDQILLSIQLESKIDAYSESAEFNIPDDWTTIEIYNIGSISIPPTMELRDDNSFVALAADIVKDKISNKLKIELTRSDVIFQPKGLNERSGEALKNYSRILINVTKGKPDDFYKYNESYNFSASEKKEMDDYFREETERPMKDFNIKLLKWYPFEIVEINDMSVFKMSFLRQMGNNEPVYVEGYTFNNYDERIEITLSYRESEKDRYAKDFSNVVKTFNLTNKK